jgi:cell fate regulator YaaT (PSP1 superfamily)
MDYTLDKGNSRLTAAGCKRSSWQMLSVYDWLADIPVDRETMQYVEVQFKNTRKGYYLNSTEIPLEKGDIVAVESNPGHDIGTVTLQGYLVALQMRKNGYDPTKSEVRRIYRKAKPADIEKWEESKAKEHDAMLRTRQIAKDLNLDMKIGDVEYQGDGNKAIFYYIADQRVDFRELIKVLADTFHVRIEMKQIGARQEAGRIGGTGPCGRELCCSTFMTNFRSVGTNAARVQDLSMNPQKLAGQCAKLKCCLNYEFDNYVEALKDFPSKDIVLETAKGPYYFFKLDVFARKMTYSADKKAPVDLLEMPLDEVWKIINENKKGKKVSEIQTSESKNEPEISFENAVGEGSLTRFDKNKKKKKHKHRPNNQKPSDSGAENK